MVSGFWFGVGFFVATGFWGFLAHKLPTVFAWIVSSGATVVNNVDNTVKAAVTHANTTPTANT